jgi:hypothetical protein
MPLILLAAIGGATIHAAISTGEKSMFENFKGWRTIIISMAIGALGVAQQANWVDVIPAEWVGVVVAAIGALMMILRSMTSTPIGKPE